MRMLTFDEFREVWRNRLRGKRAAESILERSRDKRRGWIEWPGSAAERRGWPEWTGR